ncbi:hypothetical protein FM042_07970 [Aliidiomarina halalkaliphila]|uniref:Phosphoribosyltransferase n=1 Tax=Aliidiomarina halalkaliphila TaxID=2593535 RepID=A0A552X1J2_9GAMM|nr:hypothetical protein [Aliidiomarina halalkaliphila]TRW48910.1 hypothetical protein FM042_07970 [Aliidiomarina halalkaliphila]
MPNTRLNKIDAASLPFHRYLDNSDECFYFYEYTVGMGYSASDPNQLIFNLKKSVTRKGYPDYRHKQNAIGRVARLLSGFDFTDWCFVPIPPSKEKTHPEYDSRMVDILQNAKTLNNSINWHEAILLTKSHAANHLQEGNRMGPDDLEHIYKFNAPATPYNNIIIFDDVLTTGSHFKAMKRVILQQNPFVRIRGVFIARSVYSKTYFDDEV